MSTNWVGSTYWIGVHSGNPNDPLGRRPEFVQGGYDWLIDETLAAFERGWANVRWHQFRGNPTGQRLYASACGRQVHTSQELALLDRRLHTLPKAPCLYTGVWVDTAGSLVLTDARARYPDPTKPNDAAWLQANWELWLGYGVRDIMLDNSVVQKAGAVKLAGWFATKGATMGMEGWDVDWSTPAIGPLSWRMPSLHTLEILERQDPSHRLTAHARPASATHTPTVLVQRAWDQARGALTPVEVICGKIAGLRRDGFPVDYMGEDHPMIHLACNARV